MRNESDTTGSMRAIKLSHQLNGHRSDLRDYYRTWADSYDADVTAQEYIGPEFACDLIDRWSGKQPDGVRVLDVGCGTGRVGRLLAGRGYSAVDGCDLSEDMIRIASTTHAYRTLRAGTDANWHLGAFRYGDYDIVVSCGMFTVGHVRPQALNELVKATRPGGTVIVSTRQSYLADSHFEDHVTWLAEERRVDIRQVIHNAPYIAEEAATFWVLDAR